MRPRYLLPGRYQRHTDAYGNLGHILVMDSPHDEIRIVVSGQISVDEQNAHRPSDGSIIDATRKCIEYVRNQPQHNAAV